MALWGLSKAGFAVELLETRHVRDAFEAMPVKTNREDAHGIKSLPAQEVRTMLPARKLLQAKLHDGEMSLRAILRDFGLQIGRTMPRAFDRAHGTVTIASIVLRRTPTRS